MTRCIVYLLVMVDSILSFNWILLKQYFQFHNLYGHNDVLGYKYGNSRYKLFFS